MALRASAEREPSRASLAVGVHLDAILSDGTAIALVTGRGFDMDVVGDGPFSLGEDELVEEVRTTLGPDEPTCGRTQDRAETEYWEWLARELAARDLRIDAAGLRRLPFRVVLGADLRSSLEAGEGCP